MASRALVIGATGLVGRSTHAALESSGWDAIGTSRQTSAGMEVLDICDEVAVARMFKHVNPSVALLPAALTDVDACEADPDRAKKINVDGALHVAKAAAAAGSLLVYYSTDYVFDGADGPYMEDA